MEEVGCVRAAAGAAVPARARRLGQRVQTDRVVRGGPHLFPLKLVLNRVSGENEGEPDLHTFSAKSLSTSDVL